MSMRGRVVTALLAAEVLGMSLWFSASAVVPQLARAWGLSASEQAWLTTAVQFGFVVGALVAAVTNVADRVPAQTVFAASALAGAAANAAIALLRPSFAWVVLLRGLTGAALAGVYPPAMKLMVSWYDSNRGLAVGTLVGATTVGSALPHLFAAVPVFAAGLPPWPAVLLTSSAAAAVAAVLAAVLVRPGPHLPLSAPFDASQALQGFRDPALRRANFGYLGHMWELYAVWTWLPIYLLAAFRAQGLGEGPARLLGFATVAIGALGCIWGGGLADRYGRTVLTSLALAVSGLCCLLVGFVAGVPWLLAALCLVWGVAVVADSAQFSTAVAELAPGRYVGTALTMQTAAGFLLTTASIRLVPVLVGRVGWAAAFGSLAIGPAFGIYHMLRLRASDAAARLAHGRG